VLVLIVVDWYVDFSPPVARALEIVDASVCAFFVLEFTLKVLAAPARLSWFLRHVVTDLLPALPALLLFAHLPVPSADEALALRLARFLRLAQLARYVQALRPALRIWRLALFLVRGSDRLVHRLSPLLNRNLLFFENSPETRKDDQEDDGRRKLFNVLRREHVLLERAPKAAAAPILEARATHLRDRLLAARPRPLPSRAQSAVHRDIPVERAIESLYDLVPDQVHALLHRKDLASLDRVVRILSAPGIRLLPFFRRLAVTGGNTPEERVAGLAHRIANQLETWRSRLVWFADLHGIVTGPQILDRTATALMKATQRPAVRLLLFGGLFSLVRLVIGEGSVVSELLKRFVATPLVVLGAVCFAILVLARWLKALAGEAAASLVRTSEAHYLSLLELGKLRHEALDVVFLARRVSGEDEDGPLLSSAVRAVREGRVVLVDSARSRTDLHAIALLYLHYLDGGILHESDTKTTEQLLANLALQDVRAQLGFGKSDWKRLKKLNLDEGTVFGGPYLWFRFVVESVALEAGKRILDYNRNCLSKTQVARASATQREVFARWLERRKNSVHGRMSDKVAHARTTGTFAGFEFSALDFVASDEARDARIAELYGKEVLEVLQLDRARMIREIFGTRPLDKLPPSERSLNFFVLYQKRLSGGRLLFLPLFFALWLLTGVGFVVRRIGAIAREILRPEKTVTGRESGRAPFAVALRKIHRMKGPGLLEAMRMRVLFDPEYSGAPLHRGQPMRDRADSDLERDLDFLQLNVRDRRELRSLADRARERVAAWRRAMSTRAEPALVVAAAIDRESMLTLLLAEEWLQGELPRLEDQQFGVGVRFLPWLVAKLRGGGHPVAKLAKRLGPRLSRRVRARLLQRYVRGDAQMRKTIDTWVQLPPDVTPTERAMRLVAKFASEAEDTQRDLMILRSVQSLTILDVRNYRDLVFRLGGYAQDGEDERLATALPT